MLERNMELTHTELANRLNKSLTANFLENMSWSAETVKLDLEAREIIERMKSKSQEYCLKSLTARFNQRFKPR